MATPTTDAERRTYFLHRFATPLPSCGASMIPGALGCDRPALHDGPHHGTFEHLGEQFWTDPATLRVWAVATGWEAR